MGRALKADGWGKVGWGLGSVTPPGMVNMEEAGAPHGDGAVRGMVTEGGPNCNALRAAMEEVVGLKRSLEADELSG